jgi:hypothetical protein
VAVLTVGQTPEVQGRILYLDQSRPKVVELQDILGDVAGMEDLEDLAEVMGLASTDLLPLLANLYRLVILLME